MKPEIIIFGKILPSYGVTGVIGFLAGMLLVFILSKKLGGIFDSAVCIYLMGMLGAMGGSKLLYLLINIRSLIHDLPYAFEYKEAFLNKYVRGGLVFYGGMLGAILGVVIFIKMFKVDFNLYRNIVMPGLILFAAFGRVGCFLTGCCYGRETDSAIGVVFRNAAIADHPVKLIPTQLIEAVFDLLLVALFIYLGKNKKFNNYLTRIYLVLYAVFRFILEFYRGDSARGFVLGLSSSQWISIIIVLCVVIATHFFCGKNRAFLI